MGQTATHKSSDARQHLAEVAEILALGLRRLRARQSRLKRRGNGDSLLDFTASQSGHAEPECTGRLA